MATVLVTGMSGTGKSTALAELARRGFDVVDTDYDGWSEEVLLEGGRGFEQLWREESMDALLAEHRGGHLFVSGTVANQVNFYPRFHAVVLLSAPLDVLLARIESRTNNDFGKRSEEHQSIVDDYRDFEPLLHRRATSVIDATRSPLEIADELVAVADAAE